LEGYVSKSDSGQAFLDAINVVKLPPVSFCLGLNPSKKTCPSARPLA
jgi:hypothetical protein